MVLIGIDSGRMIIPEEHTPLLDIRNRLAISYALATSVKLGSFEDGIEKTIQDSRYIPEELAIKGHISLNKQEVSRKIGELYMQKSSVNLMYDILDAPDFFWDFDNLRFVRLHLIVCAVCHSVGQGDLPEVSADGGH